MLHPEQLLRQWLAEATVQLAQPIRRGRTPRQSTFINLVLNSYMGFRLELKIPPPRIRAVLALQCMLNLHGMGVMSLDQIAVIAVHGTNKARQRRLHAPRQTTPKTRCAPYEIDNQVAQVATMTRPLANLKWLHQRNVLTTIHDRVDVRFIVRSIIDHNTGGSVT